MNTENRESLADRFLKGHVYYIKSKEDVVLRLRSLPRWEILARFLIYGREHGEYTFCRLASNALNPVYLSTFTVRLDQLKDFDIREITNPEDLPLYLGFDIVYPELAELIKRGKI